MRYAMSECKALLLTDVVDSTQLADALGPVGTSDLWARHDRQARDLLPGWRGREIDKTDGMLLLFESADDALGYAVEYQRSLASLTPPLQARAGLHVGPVALRTNSAADVERGAKPVEVDGAAKAAAARVMSVAMGRQILLSSAARDALGSHTPPLQSHGHWRIKGLAEPLELFEAGHELAPLMPPPDAEKAYRVAYRDGQWLAVREIPNGLPAERDEFVGQAQVLAELGRRVQSGARLVSVVGIGGSGKTRLAIRFGWRWLGDFAGGVWFCDLASARSVDGIVHAVASALDVPLGAEDPTQQLGRAIAARGPCLLILDNFEQVLHEAQATLGRWLDKAPKARFLVTSRQVLGLTGEEVLRLQPLSTDDAELLFLRRSEAAGVDPRKTMADRPAVQRLVSLLDGLPLAIELAAARARVMSPGMLLERMGDRFKLLSTSGGRRDRQATLRAAFDWSWDLLSDADKAALAQLSVFTGSLTLEAAEAVLDLSACGDDTWTVDAVQSLVDKSFVRKISDNRFDLLMSVQDYAAHRLAVVGSYPDSGPSAQRAAEARHAGWFAALGERRATDDACADLDNLVVACRRATSADDPVSAVGALEGAWCALRLRGPVGSAVPLAEAVCAIGGLDDRCSARSKKVLADALMMSGSGSHAQGLLDAALAHARAAHDRHAEGQVMCSRGWALLHNGRTAEARQAYAAAIEMAQELAEPALESTARSGLGSSEVVLGHTAEAVAQYELALDLAVRSGYRREQANYLANLGNLYMLVGRMDKAIGRSEEALGLARETGNRSVECNTLCNLGFLHLVQGDVEQSRHLSSSALGLARDIGNARTEAIVLCNLGIALERDAHPQDAADRFAAGLAIVRELGDQRMEGQFLGYYGALHARQGRHDEARRCFETGDALLRGASDSLGLGLLVCNRAEAEHLSGAADAALRSLREAEAAAEAAEAGPLSEIGQALARVRSLIGAPAGSAPGRG